MQAFFTNNQFFPSALIVALVMYLRAGRPRAHWAVTLLAGLALTAAVAWPAPGYLRVMLVFCCWALACFAWELTGPLFRTPRTWDFPLLAQMAFTPAVSLVTAVSLSVSILLTPVTLDLYLYEFDGSLGFQPAFLTAQLLLRYDWLRLAAELAYMNLPLGLAWVYLRQPSRRDRLSTLAFVLAIGAVGYACYFLAPAVGPAAVFGRAFPLHPPRLASLQISPVPMPVWVPRNCMPSLHASWALAIVWSARAMSGWQRHAIRAFAALAVLYACAAGGHYFIDLVVALPFTLAMYALTKGPAVVRQRAGQAALSGGVVLVAAWLVILRWGGNFFPPSQWAPWAAILLTAGATLGLKWNLDAAETPLLETAPGFQGASEV